MHCAGNGKVWRLLSALENLSAVIGSKNDAYKFLLSKNSSKNNSHRFISWLLALKIISGGKETWFDKCNSYHTQYQTIAETLIKDNDNPLSSLPKNDLYQIKNDIIRTICYFNRMASEVNVKSVYTKYTSYIVSRIITVMSIVDHTFRYIQGCDRYVYNAYLVSLIFCLENGLPLSFAESSAFVISSKIMQISNISHYLDDPVEISEHFEALDIKMEKANPSVMKEFATANQSSIHFALRWEILLFAEEHSFRGLMLLWDHIIAHKSCSSSYIESLCIAHFKQAPGGSLTNLQHYKEWDYDKLLLDASEEFEKYSSNRNGIWKTFALFALVGIAFIGKATIY
jgi:hypothetical protein